MADTKNPTTPATPKAERTFSDELASAERAIKRAEGKAPNAEVRSNLSRARIGIQRAKVDAEAAALGI